MDKNRILEILIVCIVSGTGMIYSGHILNNWRLTNYLKEEDELWMLITPLLGLKGNLEMTLASRLATTAKLCGLKNIVAIGYKNLIITQIQGILVGFSASILVAVFNALSGVDNMITVFCYQFIRLVFIGIFTASTACLILGIVTIGVVYMCWKLKFDPDNIASPLAAALGDTFTLSILYFYVNLCPSSGEVGLLHVIAIVCMLAIVLPLLARHVVTKEDRSTLRTCLFSIFPAMILSSLSGLVLKIYVFKVRYLVALQPLVNGVGGNVASILCSSMSTNCHKMKRDDNYKAINLKCDFTTLRRSLILISIVTHSIILLIGNVLGLITLSSLMEFILPYFFAVLAQITILLYMAEYIITLSWKYGLDPDNCSIPLTTGLGDIIGTSLLCVLLTKLLKK